MPEDMSVQLWRHMQKRYEFADMFMLAWKDEFPNASEREVFWMFGAGLRFKIWAARKFLQELKECLPT